MIRLFQLAPRLVLVMCLAVLVSGCGRTSRLASPYEESVAGLPAGSDAAARGGPAPAPLESAGSAIAPEGAREITGPMTITEPGAYRLARDLDVASGDGIVVAASHVRLWLGDHRLRGPGNKLGRAIVVEGVEDVQVRGGRIERFGIGAALLDARRCRLLDVTIQGGDETADPGAGNPPQIGVLLVDSPMNLIAGNDVRDVNLGLFVRGAGSYSNHVFRNEIVAAANGLLAICYNPASGMGPSGPHEDLVSSNLLARFRTGIQASAGSAENRFTDNFIRYFDSAYEDFNGTNEFERNRTEQLTP